MRKINLLQSTGLASGLATAVAFMAIGVSGAHAQGVERDEIVVTGEKRGKSVQDTATSTEIVTAEDIQKLNVVDLEDALRRIGNAGFTTVGSGRNDQFVLRGVPSGGVTPGTTPVATLIVDGAFIPNQAAGATISNAWDVTQIEVLRGAQSTLQGRNSLIGAIIVNTQDPTYEWDFQGRATYAEGNTWETSVAVGGPLIEDELAFRIAAQRLESDGFVTRTDGSNGDEEESTMIRGKLLVEPSQIPGLRWDLVATYSEEEDGSVLVSGANPKDRLQTFDIATRTDREILILGSELSYELNDQFTLTSVTSFANLKTDEVADFDGLPDLGVPVSAIRNDARDSTDWLQEIRVLYDNGDNLEILFGGLYARRFSDDISAVQQTLPVPVVDLADLTALGLPGLGLDPVYLGGTLAATGGVLGEANAVAIPTPASAPRLLNDPLLLGDFAPLGSDFNFRPEFTTYAVFGEASYDVTDVFNLTFGFRYEREEADYAVDQVNALLETSDLLALTPGGNPGLSGAVDAALVTDLTSQIPAATVPIVSSLATPGIVPFYSQLVGGAIIAANGGDENVLTPIALEESLSFEAFLPKVVATLDVSDDVSVAFSAQRAYRPGGIGINPVRASTFGFEPEFSWNYEVALRSITMDGKLLVNANVFYIDWKDQQVEVFLSATPQDSETQNVGSSELYGFETDISYQATDDLEFFASLGVIETEITAVDASNAALLGNEFPFAAAYSGSAGFTYTHPSGFNGTIDVNYQGQSEAILPNRVAGGTGLPNDSRVLTNFRIGYDMDNYSVFVFGSNVFNETYFVNADALAGNVIVGDPRVIGGGITFDF
ncbi:MAG: TonB-dependent receptor [Pseudomonadota bacterium]